MKIRRTSKQLLFPALILIGISLLTTRCVHDPWLPDGGIPVPIDTTTTGGPGHPCDPDTVYFVNDILPLIASSCAIPGCHDPASAEDGVILNNYVNIMNTTEVKPGDPTDSKLYEVLVESGDDKMPPAGSGISLTNDQISMIFDWIAQGALNNACDDDLAGCDTAAVSFSNDLVPILTANCLGCHSGTSPSAGVRVETYSQVKALADNGSLYGTINHESGYVGMPYNQPRLSDCKVAKFRNWIADGAPNN